MAPLRSRRAFLRACGSEQHSGHTLRVIGSTEICMVQ